MRRHLEAYVACDRPTAARRPPPDPSSPPSLLTRCSLECAYVRKKRPQAHSGNHFQDKREHCRHVSPVDGVRESATADDGEKHQGAALGRSARSDRQSTSWPPELRTFFGGRIAPPPEP